MSSTWPSRRSWPSTGSSSCRRGMTGWCRTAAVSTWWRPRTAGCFAAWRVDAAVEVARSLDRGGTWPLVVTVASDGASNAAPALVVTEKDELFLWYHTTAAAGKCYRLPDYLGNDAGPGGLARRRLRVTPAARLVGRSAAPGLHERDGAARRSEELRLRGDTGRRGGARDAAGPAGEPGGRTASGWPTCTTSMPATSSSTAGATRRTCSARGRPRSS